MFKNAQYAAEASKKKEIEEQINLAVIASYGTDGKIDNELLKENLNKIKGIETIEDIVYPLTAKVDGYEFKISKNGDVTYNGEIKLADGTVDSSRGIEPSGTIDITENGEYDVTNYATANVSVPVNTPSGTKKIITTENNIDVSSYEYADTSELYTESDATGEGRYWKSGSLMATEAKTYDIDITFMPSKIVFTRVDGATCIYNSSANEDKTISYFYNNEKASRYENTLEDDTTDNSHIILTSSKVRFYSFANQSWYWFAIK